MIEKSVTELVKASKYIKPEIGDMVL